MADTSIEWTDKTWNPTRGCKRVSPGCKNCYAERMAMRFSGPGQPYEGLVHMTSQGPKWTGIVREVPGMLDAPLHWKKPQRIFVDSMSDLFEEQVSGAYIDKVFAVMALCPQHTFQILTKRPERMREYFASPDRAVKVQNVVDDMEAWDGKFIPRDQPAPLILKNWPLPNVWLGVSVEDQERADERIPLLLETPAAVRFISAEPLLGPVNISRWLDPTGIHCIDVCPDAPYVDEKSVETTEVNGEVEPLCPYCGEVATWTGYDSGIDWIIAGGESGPGARPSHPDWFRSLHDQCSAAGVAFLFKQWGNWAESGMVEYANDPGYQYVQFATGVHNFALMHNVGKKAAGRLLDGRTWDGFPS